MRRFLAALVVAVVLWAEPAAAWVLIDHKCGFTNSSSASVTLNTTNAGLVVMSLSYYGGAPTTSDISDTTTSTWALTSRRSLGCGGCNGQFAYAFNITTSSSHVFTFAPGVLFPSICVAAFSGNDTTAPFDQENFTTNPGSTTTIAAGSVTPSGNGYLLMTMLGSVNVAYGSNPSIDTGYTFLDQQTFQSGTAVGIAHGYFVQTTAAAINPTWTVPNSDTIGAIHASFKFGTGGGGGPTGSSPAPCLQRLLGVGCDVP